MVPGQGAEEGLNTGLMDINRVHPFFLSFPGAIEFSVDRAILKKSDGPARFGPSISHGCSYKRSFSMKSRIVRSIAYVATTALLLVVGAVLIANFNVQPVHAGGSPQPLYQLISTQITANATFTIYTTTKILGTSTYTVHSQSTGSDYSVAVLGTDYICIQSAKGDANHPLCIPYSAIAGLTY
jgi:hypothetical protein